MYVCSSSRQLIRKLFNFNLQYVAIFLFHPSLSLSLSLSLSGLLSANDSVIGDPLFTVPFREDQTSLCFEVHGKANNNFNLVSDTCTNVNAYFAPMLNPR